MRVFEAQQAWLDNRSKWDTRMRLLEIVIVAVGVLATSLLMIKAAYIEADATRETAQNPPVFNIPAPIIPAPNVTIVWPTPSALSTAEAPKTEGVP